MNVDFDALAAFLRRANLRTYAADAKKVVPTQLASNDFEYHEGSWRYHDTYFGSADFIGEEIVCLDDRPVWGMNYYGGVVDPGDTKDTYAFLKRALLQDSGNLPPVRGPAQFSDGAWTYEHLSQGMLAHCSGTERILRDGLVVYKAEYHGGVLQ